MANSMQELIRLNRAADLGAVAESFFHVMAMHYAITLNNDKVKEALDLIHLFSKSCDIAGDDWVKHQDAIIERMREFR